MPFSLHKVTADAEFGPIVAVEHEAYSKPYNGLWAILKGPSQEDFCARQLSWHKSDPSSHWLYVTDEGSKEVVGAAGWNIHETNPYANGAPVILANWWPEGNLKEISDQILAGFFSARPSRTSKAHFLLNYCFVKSTHRHRGVASLLMKWGTETADEMGLECFVESTEDGRGLYEAHGFKIYGEINLDARLEEPNKEFTRLRKELGCPIHSWYMWRPNGGTSEETEPSRT
ncbi:MAG: hypothetical protein M1818_001755 [Claussenomyces sp. TS43310]|nr:MAG: hypothetical protein M1818_001755 [Claussenomyces sp. TS43310]